MTLLFEQGGSMSHTSKSNINLINNLFTLDDQIQNPQKFFKYCLPIETLWVTLKKKSQGEKSWNLRRFEKNYA